jgi:hypothetical protein
MNNRSLFIAAGIAGAATAVISSLPLVNLLNCLFCGWLWVGGAAGVWLYQRDAKTTVTSAQGAGIGALTGLVGAVLGAVIGLLFSGLGLGLMTIADAQASRDLFDTLLGAGILQGLGLVFSIVLYPAFGALGGVIGASIFKSSK